MLHQVDSGFDVHASTDHEGAQLLPICALRGVVSSAQPEALEHSPLMTSANSRGKAKPRELVYVDKTGRDWTGKPISLSASWATLSWCGAGRGWPLGVTSMAVLPSCDHTQSCLWGHHHRPHHEVSAPRHLVHRAQHPPQRRQRHAAKAKAKKTDQQERTDTKQDAPPSTGPKEDRQDFGLDSVNPLSVGRRTRCGADCMHWLNRKIIQGQAHADLLLNPQGSL